VTGLTAVFAGLYFALAVFFAPIFASIPPWATGGSLIIVGALMCRNLAKVQWERVDHALTAFVTIMLMPLTYSIAYGIIGGFLCWIALQIIFYTLSLSLFGIKLPYEESYSIDGDIKPSHIKETHQDMTVHDSTHHEPKKEAVGVIVEEIEQTTSFDDKQPISKISLEEA
jgi:AGZA family xanthine/uracil permease-like MFS transporter